jgi:hypothetical protein
MGKVTIYQYTTLDTDIIEPRKAKRWGTRESIDRLKHADLIEDSAILVDEAMFETLSPARAIFRNLSSCSGVQ